MCKCKLTELTLASPKQEISKPKPKSEKIVTLKCPQKKKNVLIYLQFFSLFVEK